MSSPTSMRTRVGSSYASEGLWLWLLTDTMTLETERPRTTCVFVWEGCLAPMSVTLCILS